MPSNRACRASAIVCLVVALMAPSGASASPAWSVTPSPNPAGQASAILVGVACPGPAYCIAVGYSRPTPTATSAGRTLFERWNGKVWSITPSPNPADSKYIVIGGVGCSGPSNCFAVGDFFTRGSYKPLVEHWNGTKWSIITVPVPKGPGGSLTGVACPGPTTCFAVGSYDTATTSLSLTERWNGKTWSIVPSPKPLGHAFAGLGSVACLDATHCTAVGATGMGIHLNPLVERWNGSKWTIVASPEPAGTTYVLLSGVACVTLTNCTVVGSYLPNGSSESVPIIEHWDGVTWSLAATPTDPSISGASLSGIACSGPSDCTAVGVQFLTSGATNPFVEHWDGTNWTIVPTPTPGGTQSVQFTGVSCRDAASCIAIGLDQVSQSTVTTFIERYA
jgi:hypothetical protein